MSDDKEYEDKLREMLKTKKQELKTKLEEGMALLEKRKAESLLGKWGPKGENRPIFKVIHEFSSSWTGTRYKYVIAEPCVATTGSIHPVIMLVDYLHKNYEKVV